MFLSAERPQNEAERLARLRALDVLDTPPEPMFDALVEAAAAACGTPIALITLVDESRQWFKAAVGIKSSVTETRREISFCAHALLGRDDFLEVRDTRLDRRFRDNPIVTHARGIVFYAGATIALSDGTKLGALSVLDRKPRALEAHEKETLRRLAKATAAAFESRERASRALADANRAQTQMATLYRSTPAALFSMDTDAVVLTVSDQFLEETGYARDDIVGRCIFDILAPESRERAWTVGLPSFLATGRTLGLEYQIVRKDGRLIDVLVSQTLERDENGVPVRSMSVIENVTRRKAAEAALRSSQSFLERVGQVSGVGGWEVDLCTGEIKWSDQMCAIHDLPPGSTPTSDQVLGFFTDEARPSVEHAVAQAVKFDTPYDLELPFVSARGRRFWARIAGSAEREGGRAVRLVGAMQDVTKRKEIENDLARHRELLQVTLDSIADAVVTTDTRALVQWLNPVAERLTGWTKADAVGRPLHEVVAFIDEATREAAPNPVALCLGEAKPVAVASRLTMVARNRDEYAIENSASPIRDSRGRVLGAVLVFRDVSEQRRLHLEMSHRATHDTLTGLLNRSEFETRLSQLIATAEWDPTPHALLFIDLDQFKLVNDACGHAAGDALLKQVGQILRGCVRGHDTLVRLGGDEFGIILEHCGLHDAARVAQGICDEVDRFRYVHDGRRFRVGTSIGLVPIDARWANGNALIQAADAACYAAKEGGRNRVHTWVDADQTVTSRTGDMQWVNRLELALDEDRFELFGQRIDPIAGDERGLHFEVLLRMRDVDGSIVMPGAFLPAAERFHIANRIDRHVVRKAFEWLAFAEAEGAPIGMMSINLSGQSLGDRAFHRDVAAMLLDARFDVRRVCFEITETAAITHLADARRFIDDMRTLGVKVALDDFGAGASSFGYLKSLPVDFLKIDGHFIKTLLEDKLNNAAVRCFCDVAKVVGVRTIAEFVERQDVRDALRELGVDMAQGYLVHKPEPLANLLVDRYAKVA